MRLDETNPLAPVTCLHLNTMEMHGEMCVIFNVLNFANMSEIRTQMNFSSRRLSRNDTWRSGAQGIHQQQKKNVI